MTTSTSLAKKIAAGALVALTMGTSLTMTTGAAEARNGRQGALIAAGILGALAVGAIAAQANDHHRGGYVSDDGYVGPGGYVPTYQQPVQYDPGYRSYGGYGYGHRHPRQYHGYSETGFVYRGPVCKIRKQRVWDGYGWGVQRVEVCR